ncbi:hypothetical protein [Leptospira santarosai]|uniref:Uncharacterized protein n=1 Tax=Leptospira santarosai TaxID=28183 RepID=A0AB73N341_9LEPT|nr:hypothetical protein [Leptospira santarosai]OLY64723.1 hypothetical protein BWD11_07720 [Leptospira santarosai serovar Grippotyphosa]ONF80373.1 hypothetical protein BWD12_05990 [Leptospira santarosai serovar Bananal]ONF84709.1 hypothetical protein BWD13_15380 [Leptospira santarosai serovar Grippotyphosa]ONF94097.1 hypothetical protein BWD14_04270 [Leptospira santarosai]
MCGAIKKRDLFFGFRNSALLKKIQILRFFHFICDFCVFPRNLKSKLNFNSLDPLLTVFVPF